MYLFAQGIEELNAGQLDAALETFKQITTTAPDFPDAHYHLGLVYYRRAQFREAAAAFKQTLKFLHRDVAALVNLGLASYRAAEMSEAVNAYRTALEIQPHNVEALNNLGLAYQELGQFEEAIAAYDEALRLRPDLPEVEANLATAHELQRGYLFACCLSALSHWDAVEARGATPKQLSPRGNRRLPKVQTIDSRTSSWRKLILREAYTNVLSLPT